MTFNWEMLRLIDERIKASQGQDKTLGIVSDGTNKLANTITVLMDGSGLAVPCKVFKNSYYAPGARVGLVKFGAEWWVVGTVSPHLGPVQVSNGGERDAFFPPDRVPTGQQVFVQATKELEMWTGTAWVGVCPRRAVRPTPESRTNNSMADDSYITLPVEGGAKYKLETFLTQDAGTTGDFRWGFGYPTGTVGYQTAGAGFFFIHPAAADVDQTPVFQEWTITDAGVVAGGETGAGAWRPVLARTMFIAGGNGTVVLRWAQNVTEAATCTLGAGSYMELWRTG